MRDTNSAMWIRKRRVDAFLRLEILVTHFTNDDERTYPNLANRVPRNIFLGRSHLLEETIYTSINLVILERTAFVPALSLGLLLHHLPCQFQ